MMTLREQLESTDLQPCKGETSNLAKVLCEEMFSLSSLPFRIHGPDDCASTNTC